MKQGEVKRNGEIIKNIIRVISLIIQSSRITAIKLVIANIFIGTFIPLNLIVWKSTINSTVESIETGKITNTLIWLSVWCINICIINLGNRVCSYLQFIQSEYLNKHISDLILKKVERLNLSYFDKAENYDKVEKVNNESVNRSMSILNTCISSVRWISTIITSAALLVWLDYKIIILCVLAVIPVFIIDVKNYNKQFEVYGGRLQKLRYIDRLKDLMIKYENIKEIKIYCLNKYLREKIIGGYNEYLNEDKKIKKYMLKRVTVGDFLQNFLSFVNQAYIIFKVVAKKLSIGDFTLYINALQNLESSIREVLNAMSSIYNDNLYIDTLFEFLQEEEKEDIQNPTSFPKQFEEIRFEHVYFKYPGTERYILKDINLTIKRNQIYAFVGENGSGKTTLIKLLMGLYKPTKGNIYIDNINLKSIVDEEIFKYISIIFQDFIKYPLNVAENIGVGDVENIDNIEKIYSAGKKGGVEKIVEKLPMGYETQLQKEWDNGVDLSLGQWQKVAISRALMAESLITVLDEPTASVDPKAEQELFQNLKQLMIGKICIFITHRFSNVRLADKIVVIENGQISELDNHDNLIKRNGLYAQLYKMQAEAYAV